MIISLKYLGIYMVHCKKNLVIILYKYYACKNFYFPYRKILERFWNLVIKEYAQSICYYNSRNLWLNVQKMVNFDK